MKDPGHDQPLESPLLSVVVPLYQTAHNTSEFMKYFAPSGWDASAIEFILVDDASSDGSIGAYADALREFGRVISLSHATRQGPGNARNTGLRAASASVVAFWDSDDSPRPDVFVQLARTMRDEQADCGHLAFDIRLLESNELVECHVPTPEGSIQDALATRAAVWRFAFSRNLLTSREIIFPSNRIGEDLLFLLRAADASTRPASRLPAIGYTYYVRASGSQSRRADSMDYQALATGLAAAMQDLKLAESRALALNWLSRIWTRLGTKQKALLGPWLIFQWVLAAKSGNVRMLGRQIHEAALGAFRLRRARRRQARDTLPPPPG